MRKEIIFGVLLLVFLSGCTFQHGTHRDVVQGYDKGLVWHHLYMKNDHTTTYCFDDERFRAILDTAQKTQQDVVVTYETYLIRGILCWKSEKMENVVVTNIEFA